MNWQSKHLTTNIFFLFLSKHPQQERINKAALLIYSLRNKKEEISKTAATSVAVSVWNISLCSEKLHKQQCVLWFIIDICGIKPRSYVLKIAILSLKCFVFYFWSHALFKQRYAKLLRSPPINIILLFLIYLLKLAQISYLSACTLIVRFLTLIRRTKTVVAQVIVYN